MKHKCILGFLLLMAVLAVLPVSAEEQFSEPVISVQDCAAEQFQQICIPVIIEDNPGFAGFAIHIGYDPDVLDLTAVKKGALLPDAGYWSVNLEEAGTASVTWFHNSDAVEDGTMFQLEFTVSGTAAAGDYPIDVALLDGEPLNFVNAAGQAIACAFHEGTAAVTPCDWHRFVEETDQSADGTDRTISASFSHYDPAKQGDACLIAAGYGSTGKLLDVTMVSVTLPMAEAEQLTLSAALPIDCLKVFLIDPDAWIPFCDPYILEKENATD